MTDASRVTSTVEHFAARLADQHRELAAQWLKRLDEVIDIDVRQVFPSHTLLDHIPELILEIAGYLDAPQDQEIAANTAVLAKARELGLLRFDQRASVHQLLREYQILGETLEAFFAHEAAALGADAEATAALMAVSRANQAVRSILLVGGRLFSRLRVTVFSEPNDAPAYSPEAAPRRLKTRRIAVRPLHGQVLPVLRPAHRHADRAAGFRLHPLVPAARGGQRLR